MCTMYSTQEKISYIIIKTAISWSHGHSFDNIKGDMVLISSKKPKQGIFKHLYISDLTLPNVNSNMSPTALNMIQ